MTAQPEVPTSAAQARAGRLRAAFAVNLGLLAAEVVGGLLAGSVALLADAGHMLVDCVAVGLSLAALALARRPASTRRSFGYYRVEILAAVLNGVLLLAVGVVILAVAVRRLVGGGDVSGGLMLVFGVAGLAGNGVAVWLLARPQRESLPMRGAYLDFVTDLLGSAAVVVAAVVVAVSGFDRADAIASIAIALLILPRTWSLLGDTVNVLLEATPEGLDLDEVRRHILDTEGVAGCHDLHAWTITSGMNVLSVHVTLQDGADGPRVLDRLGDCLADHFDVEHSTFQLEPATHREHERAAHT